jgi:hypothetical protein
VALLFCFDLKIERTSCAPKGPAQSFGLELHQAGPTGGDTDRWWIERSVDSLAGVDELEPATGKFVAMIFDHKFKGRATSSALHWLQTHDAPIVEWLDRENDLGDHSVIGFAEWNDTHGNHGGAR